MTVTKRKAFAYITHNNRLLIFSHPHSPGAGIQVPAGTMHPGESPEAAALREAIEETGLTNLTLVGLIGEQQRDMSDFGMDEIHHRYFYHLRCDGDPPETWQHYESDPSSAGGGPYLFEFWWARLPDGVPELVADHGKMLPQLIEAMKEDLTPFPPPSPGPGAQEGNGLE